MANSTVVLTGAGAVLSYATYSESAGTIGGSFTTIASVEGLNVGGLQINLDTYTTIDQAAFNAGTITVQKRGTTIDAGNVRATLKWIPGATTHQFMTTTALARTLYYWKVTIDPGGPTVWKAPGVITHVSPATISREKLLQCDVNIEWTDEFVAAYS